MMVNHLDFGLLEHAIDDAFIVAEKGGWFVSLLMIRTVEVSCRAMVIPRLVYTRILITFDHHTQLLHVWYIYSYIYLHLSYFIGKCK